MRADLERAGILLEAIGLLLGLTALVGRERLQAFESQLRQRILSLLSFKWLTTIWRSMVAQAGRRLSLIVPGLFLLLFSAFVMLMQLRHQFMGRWIESITAHFTREQVLIVAAISYFFALMSLAPIVWIGISRREGADPRRTLLLLGCLAWPATLVILLLSGLLAAIVLATYPLFLFCYLLAVLAMTALYFCAALLCRLYYYIDKLRLRLKLESTMGILAVLIGLAGLALEFLAV